MIRASIIVMLFALAACSRSQGGSAEEEKPADVAGDTTAPPAGGPAASAAAPGVQQPATRHAVLLEFREPVQQADLEWLERNGFRVDTVMGGNLVRGWLEKPEGAEAIAQDGRIARISALAR